MDVYADAKGMARGLQARVNAEMAKANVTAKIKAQIDTRGLAAEAKRAAAVATKAAQSNVRVKIKAEVDTRGLLGQVQAAAKEASKSAVIKYRTELDNASVARTQAAVAAVGGGDATVNVDVDTGAARAEVEAFRREAGRDVTVNVKTKTDTSSLKQAGTALTQLSKIPMLVGGFYTLGTAIVAVGGGLVAMTSSALSASTALAAIPNIAGAGITALATLITGFSGVGDAVKQMTVVENAAGTSATATAAAESAAADRIRNAAQARADAADRVADAQRALGDALRQAGIDAKAAAESVSDAQWALARAGEAVTSARENYANTSYEVGQAAEAAADRIAAADARVRRSKDFLSRSEYMLNDAREEAQKRIDALNKAMSDSALDEEQAAANLQRARENLQDVNWNEAASPQERRDAEMAVKEAERQLKRVQDGRADLAAQTAEANAEGVDGSDEVRAAQEAITQAQQDQIDAVEELAQAREDAKRQAIAGERAIRDAAYGVRDAVHAQQESREELALAEQAQARQAVLSDRAIKDAREAVADAQRALRDASREVAAAQRDAATAADEQTAAQLKLEQAMDRLSPAGQRFATFLHDVVMPRLHDFKLAVQEALLPGVQMGVEKSLPLLDTLQTGMVKTAGILGGFTSRLGALFGSKAFNRDIAGIMDSNNDALLNFLPSLRHLIKMFVDIAAVAGPTLVEPFSRWTRELTKGWMEAAQVNRESGAMADFFKRAGDRAAMLKDILGNLFTALYNIGVAANPTGDSLLATFERTTQKWADWTKSDLGQERMQKFFEAVEPTTRAVGDLVAQLGEMLVKLSEGNAGGGLAAFVKTLTFIVNGINALADLGGGKGGVVIGWIMTLAGVGGALGLVSGVILKMAANIGKLFTLLGGIGRLVTTVGGFIIRLATGAFGILMRILGPVGNLLLNLGSKILPLIIRLAPVLGRAVSLMFGPWGIAIMAVVGLFILLYNKVGWFHDAVQWVMGKVVDAFNWVVDGAKHLWDVLFGHSVFPDIAEGLRLFVAVVGLYFGLIKEGFKAVGKVAEWLWDNAIKPAWENIKSGISKAWDKIGPILDDMWTGAKIVGGWFKDLWNKYIEPAWDSIKTAIENGWNNKIKPPLQAMWEMVEKVGGWFKDLWNKYIDPAWESIKTAIDNGWNNKIKPAFQALKDFIDTTIPNAFSTAMTAVKNFWDDVKAKAKVPIKFVLETIWNNGLRKMINAIPGVSDIAPVDTSDWATGTARVLPGYTPGRDVHHFTSPTGGRLNLSGGEAIMRPEFTDRLGEGTVNMLNRAARAGKGALEHAIGALSGSVRSREGHFATGGVFRSAVNHALNFAGGGVFLGGDMPLEGATSITPHPLPYYNTGAGWAGDLNSPGDLANPPSKILAWMPGTVAHVFKGYSDSHGRYGNHAVINNDAGGSAWYAHMSSIVSGLLGKHLNAGDQIGRVGQTGNAHGAHLHFEVRGTPVSGGIGPIQQAPVDPAVAAGEEEADGWRERIGKIKDVITSIPGWIKSLGDGSMGPWADQILTGVRSMGRDVIKWINDKIPDQIRVPNFPDIPLPNNPIPDLFDAGGEWRHGVLGLNMSGKSETVFTNTDMVDLGASLRATSAALRSMITGDGTGAATLGGGAPLVGELTLMGRKEDMPNLLADVDIALRAIRRGGVHAQRVARAPA
jgi:murein DD-endopeptidase MepM/ murein hydrolase activator NlpD